MALYPQQPTFGRGELSPKLLSRSDITDFKMGLATCLNWTVMRQGGIRRRAGTQYIDEVKNSNKVCRIIPFIFSAAQTYVLVLNDGVFRVYALGGRVGTVEVSHPWADADLATLDRDQTNDVLDVVHKLYAPQRIQRASNTSWSVGPVTFRFGPYLPINATGTILTPSDVGNAIPDMISDTAPSGTAAASSNNATAWQTMDRDPSTFWINTGGGTDWISYTYAAPKIIVGYSVQSPSGTPIGSEPAVIRAPKTWAFEAFDGTNWIVLDSQFGQSNWSDSEIRYYRFNNTTAYIAYRINITAANGGSFLNVAGFTFTESMTTAPAITITASSVTGINNNAGFSANDVGRIIALLDSSANYRAFVITAFTSTTVVSAKLDDAPLTVAQGTLQWRLGGWGITPGWPAHVATFEGRKCYARTNTQPSAIWGTKNGGYGTYLDFSTSVPLLDDDAISFTLSDVNEIQWIAEGGEDLFIGTAGAARFMGRDSPNLPFSATNFRQTLASTHGSQNVHPARAGNATLFASSFGKAIREFAPNDVGGYSTPDISIKSDHLFAPTFPEMVYAQEPDSIVWAPNATGELVGMTYEKEQDMAGFHHHQMGGNGFVENVAVIPGPDTMRDELWMIVRRTIGGVTKRYIERMAAPYDGLTIAQADAWCLDCAILYNGAPTTTVTNLGHLNGLTVQVYADGARQADKVVSGGSITLDFAASKVLVGLGYQSIAQTLPSNLSVGDGSGLGRKKKVVYGLVDVMDAGSLKTGRDVAGAEEILFRDTTDQLGAAVPLQSGFKKGRFKTSWYDNGQMYMVADGPFPATVRSITPVMETEP